jgi:TRAP transporter 4TM/12TM fusion protein
MPPVMGAAAFIIAERCNIPYLEVVRAALVPAIISYLALIYIVHIEACKLGLRPLPAAEVPRLREVFPQGIHFLVPLALLVTQLLRRFSPELAAFQAIVALAALVTARDLWRGWRTGTGVRRALLDSLARLWTSLVMGGKNMMGIGVAVAAAGIIVGVMTLGPGGLIPEAIGRLSGNSLVAMLLLSALASLLLGLGLPTTANYIVVSTLVVPALLVAGAQHGIVVPLIAAHLFCFFFGILSDDTPPVGLAAFAASAIARSDPIRTGIQGFVYDLRTAILPFMFLFNPDLLLIDVHTWWYGGLVFVAGTLAMCAFAGLTQGYMLRKNRAYESILLLLTVVVLLRPGFIANLAGGGKPLWYGIGIAAFAGVCALQRLRRGS